MKKLLIFSFIISIISCKSSKNEHLITKKSVKEEIAFVSNRDGNPEIYLMDIDGQNLRRLTNHDSLDFSPSWSKVDASLYFYSKREGNSELYSINIENNKLQRLTHHPAQDVLPVPSPNGEFVAFMTDRNSSSRNIFVMHKESGDVKSLTQNDFYEEGPDWSPDGEKIIFTRQIRDSLDTSHAANGEIHIINADGTNVERLSNKKGYDSGAKFSPDGSKIAFYGFSDDQWDLYLMNADGSDLMNLTNDSIECYSPDWSPGGDWLVYTAGTKGNYNIWKINVQTRERVQLTSTSGRNEGPSWKKIDYILVND